jgi:ribosomal protein S27E
MTCPDCELAIANFWKTGQMKHTCSHCGGTLAHCTQH